jgi:hypothetical protein
LMRIETGAFPVKLAWQTAGNRSGIHNHRTAMAG